MKLKVYAARDFARGIFLPSAVIDALGDASHHRQGGLFVWSTSATSAWKHLGALRLQGPIGSSSRALGIATGYDIECLDNAFPWPDGTILATSNYNGTVVEITARAPGDIIGDVFTTRPIGTLNRGYVFTPAERPAPRVTDDMVTAAMDHLRRYTDNEPVTRSSLRDAIAAALIVQEARR